MMLAVHLEATGALLAPLDVWTPDEYTRPCLASGDISPRP